MKLNTLERIVITDILPQRANFVELVIKNDIADKVNFKQEEIEKYGIKTEDSRISWESEAELEVEFTDFEKNMIKDSLKKLDESKQLESRHVSLYKKFNQ